MKKVLLLTLLISVVSVSYGQKKKNKEKDTKTEKVDVYNSKPLDLGALIDEKMASGELEEAKPLTEAEIKEICAGKACLTLENNCNEDLHLGVFGKDGKLEYSFHLNKNATDFRAYEPGQVIQKVTFEFQPVHKITTIGAADTKEYQTICLK